jgi:hypothetical protein
MHNAAKLSDTVEKSHKIFNILQYITLILETDNLRVSAPENLLRQHTHMLKYNAVSHENRPHKSQVSCILNVGLDITG